MASITLTTVMGLAVFMFIMMLLVAVLLIARAKLVPQGEVKITINEDKELTVSPGSTLLSTLHSQGIYLSSACGGGGTCGMCKCRVVEGGGSILPTEKGFFTRKEQNDNWRLGCQVKVRQPMRILLPESILGVRKWECEVLSNRNVATFIKEFVVKLPDGEDMDFIPGGYIQIDVPKYDIAFSDFDIEQEFRDEWDRYKMWDLRVKNREETFRAYSMANYPAEKNLIKLNIRIATPPMNREKSGFMKVPPGICSSYIFSLKPGDKITISGPYGEFHIKDTDNEMVYIGGGVGMAPLRSHIFHLFHTLKTGRKVSYWYGARSLQEVFYADDFAAIERKFPNFSFNLALSEPKPEDNWKGLTGFVHKVLHDNYLSGHEAPEEIEYYFCGPPAMNDAVVGLLDSLGVPEENVMYDDFGI